MPKRYTPTSAAADVEAALRLLEGRWKLVILFHLFGGKVMRFSDLERAIPNITQKMLGQQLRSLAVDGGVRKGSRSDEIRPIIGPWPLPPLRTKRAASGVAGLRYGRGQRKTNHVL